MIQNYTCVNCLNWLQWKTTLWLIIVWWARQSKNITRNLFQTTIQYENSQKKPSRNKCIKLHKTIDEKQKQKQNLKSRPKINWKRKHCKERREARKQTFNVYKWFFILMCFRSQAFFAWHFFFSHAWNSIKH